MKYRRERRNAWGEGWLIAAALALVLALSLALWAAGRPRPLRVEGLHDVPYEALKRIGMVDINAADAQKLALLPGIGEELARRIVEYRINNGAFAHPEDIMNVPGIGEGIFARIRDRIFVE